LRANSRSTPSREFSRGTGNFGDRRSIPEFPAGSPQNGFNSCAAHDLEFPRNRRYFARTREDAPQYSQLIMILSSRINGHRAMIEDDLFAMRDRLQKYFKGRSISNGVAINPILEDAKTTVFGRRLYCEQTSDRAIYIHPEREDYVGLDAFTKKIGLNFEVNLLAIYGGSNVRYFPALWDVYVKWMHDRIDGQAALAVVAKYRNS
jgi:hypothetical protein